MFALTALDRNHHLRGIFQRVLVWWSATGLLWLAGGRALWDYLPRSRPVAICALVALVPVAVVSSALVLLVAVALWDARAEWAKPGSK